jgi:hypothetical protein
MDTCRFVQGWACQQPGSPGLAEIEGPIPVPGPGGTTYVNALGVPQGWGQVPRGSVLSCWCANGPGTYANTTNNCVPEPCPYPARCVDSTVPFNGTVCVNGAEGIACISCSKRCVLGSSAAMRAAMRPRH